MLTLLQTCHNFTLNMNANFPSILSLLYVKKFSSQCETKVNWPSSWVLSLSILTSAILISNRWPFHRCSKEWIRIRDERGFYIHRSVPDGSCWLEDVNFEDGSSSGARGEKERLSPELYTKPDTTSTEGNIGPVSMALLRGKPLLSIWPSIAFIPS
jgi:hypothetical protein